MGEYWGVDDTMFTLAEMSLAEQLVALSRNVRDAVKDAMNAVVDLANGNFEAVRQRADKVRGYKNGAERVKEHVIEYLARLGYTLPYHYLYRQVVLQLDRIAQNSDAIAYRSMVLASKVGVKFGELFSHKLSSMAQMVFKEFETLQAAIRMLQENPRRCVDEARRTIALEEEVDQKYREIELDVVTELRNDLLALMLTREIVDLIEDTADVIKDAAENIMFIALYKVVR